MTFGGCFLMEPGAAHVSNLQQQDLEDRDDQKEEVEPIGHRALDEGFPTKQAL